MDDCKLRAIEALDLMTQVKLSDSDPSLAIASRLAFPLEALEVVQDTPRFQASFAIEVLRRALMHREKQDDLARRYGHAFAMTARWADSFK